MTDRPTITQADRDAAYNFNLYETAASILGDGEIRILASYFAKHRESAVAELQAEVARLRAENERLFKSGEKLLELKANEAAEAKFWFNKAQEWKALAKKEPVE